MSNPADITPADLLRLVLDAISEWVDESDTPDDYLMHPQDAYAVIDPILKAITSARIVEWQKNRPGPTSPTD